MVIRKLFDKHPSICIQIVTLDVMSSMYQMGKRQRQRIPWFLEFLYPRRKFGPCSSRTDMSWVPPLLIRHLHNNLTNT